MSPLSIAVRRAALLCLPSATLLANLALCACAQQPTGHTWTVTSTQQGTWSDILVNTPEPDKPENGTWPVGPFAGGGGYGFGGSGNRNGAADGTVTSTLTWTPATGKTLLTDPAPDPLFVLDTATPGGPPSGATAPARPRRPTRRGHRSRTASGTRRCSPPATRPPSLQATGWSSGAYLRGPARSRTP